MLISHFLATGEGVLIRPARSADLAQVNALQARCSLESLSARYHRGRSRLTPAEWGRLIDPARGHAWLTALADAPDQSIAVSHLLMTGDPLVREAALLVEDAWQNKGLGTLLAHHTLAFARASGCRAAVSWVSADNRRVIAISRRLGAVVPPIRSSALELTVPVDSTTFPKLLSTIQKLEPAQQPPVG